LNVAPWSRDRGVRVEGTPLVIDAVDRDGPPDDAILYAMVNGVVCKKLGDGVCRRRRETATVTRMSSQT